MVILRTRNLTKHFEGVVVVDNLSLAIHKGTITSIIGPNGAGKTTLVNMLSGMLPFDQGMLVIEGVTLSRLHPHDAPRHGITRTFQSVRLFEQMTVLDNLLVVLTERNVFAALFERHGRYHIEKADEILQQVGLFEKRGELVAALSYGQRKLLEIGRLLAMNTKIVLLDEPFAGLYPQMVKQVIGIVHSMKLAGRTIILIEHAMDIIRGISDWVFVLDSGRLLAQGRPEDALAQEEVIKAYLGE